MNFKKFWEVACHASFLSNYRAIICDGMRKKFIHHQAKAVVEYDRAYIHEFKSKNK